MSDQYDNLEKPTNAPNGRIVVWRNKRLSWNEGSPTYLAALVVWAGIISGIAFGLRSAVYGGPGSKDAWWFVAAMTLVMLPIVGGFTLLFWPDPKQAIFVDFERNEVVFENLRPYNKFFPQRRLPLALCAFDEIEAIEFERGRRFGKLTILSPAGRFIVFSMIESDSFREVSLALRSIRSGRDLSIFQRSWWPSVVGVVIFLAAVITLFLVGVLP